MSDYPTISAELMQAAGLKKAKTESRQAFLTRLVKAIAEVPDETFNGLSKPAKDWNNKNCGLMDDNKELIDFPDAAEPEGADMAATKKKAATAAADDVPAGKAAAAPATPAKPKVAVKKAAAKKKAAVKKAAAPKPPAPAAKPKVAVKKAAAKRATPKANADAPAVEKKTKGKGKTSSLEAIRKAIIAKPNITEKELMDKLVPTFPDLKIGTVSTTRAGARSVMKLLPEYKDKFKT